jgi:hypothetical protein
VAVEKGAGEKRTVRSPDSEEAPPSAATTATITTYAMVATEANRSGVRALWERKRVPSREVRKGSSAKDVTGSPSRNEPPKPRSEGVGGTSVVAALPRLPRE